MSNFEEGKPDWYTPANVVENDFLNAKLETDQYGIFYSVRFEGDAETFLWQSKTAPEEGKAYYGHIEKAKSGKSMRFKKDKPPEDSSTSPANAAPAYQGNGEAIIASMVVKLAFQAFIQAEGLLPQEETHWNQIHYMADMLYETIGKVKNVKPEDFAVVPSVPEEMKARPWDKLGKDKIVETANDPFPDEEN